MMINLPRMLALISLLLLTGCSLKPFGIAPIVIVFGKVEVAGAKTETNRCTRRCTRNKSDEDKDKTPIENAAAQINRIENDGK